jgi:hypothetical protein
VSRGDVSRRKYRASAERGEKIFLTNKKKCLTKLIERVIIKIQTRERGN